MESSGNLAINFGNLDFFFELTATPEDWPRLLAYNQKLLDELIADKYYDPLDPSQRRLKSRPRKNLLKDYVNCNDYNPFDSSAERLTSDGNDRYYDNYISKGLYGTSPVNQQDFAIQDAMNMDLRPNYKSNGRNIGFVLWAGCIYLPTINEEKSFTRNY